LFYLEEESPVSDVGRLDGDEFRERGLELIRQKNEAAEALTEAMSLPPEDKYHTLSLLYGGKPRTLDAVGALTPR
jgi:hypothetical protein